MISTDFSFPLVFLFCVDLRAIYKYGASCALSEAAFSQTMLAPLASMLKGLAPQSRAEQLNDTRLARVRGMSGGLASNYIGMFALLKDEQLSSAYKLAMLESLADVAASVQAAMALDTRKQVLAELNMLDPAVKAPFGKHLDQIAAAMRSNACEGLCAIQ